jgi:hypothetical protein
MVQERERGIGADTPQWWTSMAAVKSKGPISFDGSQAQRRAMTSDDNHRVTWLAGVVVDTWSY